MKKLLAMLLAFAVLMSMVTVVSAEEPTTATAWLLYFASNHEKDSAKFPWWPQHQRVDQPASETGVEATNAQITGPGKYTVGLKFNWQKAEGAIQFNLIIDNAEVLFPGYYVDITDIRVNGESIALKENYYGTYHDDTNAGMVPLYNTYWDPAFTPDAVGPYGYRSFDGTPEDATHMVINPDDIVNGDTIEVDFVFAAEPGAAPEELGEKPEAGVALVEGPKEPLTGNETTAYLFWQDQDWWPATTHLNDDYWEMTTATITGEGHYTVGITAHMPQWFIDQNFHNTGAQKLAIVIQDGNDLYPGMYLNITDIRINGVSVAFDPVTYGATGYDNVNSETGYAYWDANDTYAVLYDQYFINTEGASIWGGTTWDSSAEAHNYGILDVDALLNDPDTIEIDFFLSAEQDVMPPLPVEVPDVWYNSNTVGLAGLSLKDLGIANDWHNIVPVNVSETGYQVFTLVGADAHVIGHAYVIVNNGNITVEFDYAGGPTAMLREHSQCVKWFTSLEDITPEALANHTDGLTGADVVNVQNDLGGVDIAFLSINNKVTWRSPIDAKGNNLPRYWRNMASWVAYREALMALIETPEEVPAE